MNTDTESKLIADIYNAAMEPQHWHVVLKTLQRVFESSAVGIFNDSLYWESHKQSLSEIIAGKLCVHATEVAEVEPWIAAAPDSVLSDDIFIRGRYQEWCQQLGLCFEMRGTLSITKYTRKRLAFFRSCKFDSYTENDIFRYRRLLPHLQNAIKINQRIDQVNTLLSSRSQMLDVLKLGILIYDNEGTLLFKNLYADREIDQSLYASKAYLAAIERAIHVGEIAHFGLERTHKKPLSVSVFMLNGLGELNFHQTNVCAIVSDPEDRSQGNAKLLAKRWLLTDNEAKIAVQLLRGYTLKEIAESRSLKLGTVQWYCKEIMQKVGVKRQTDLCLLLAKESLFHSDDLLCL